PSDAFGGSGTVHYTPYLTSEPVLSAQPEGGTSLLAAGVPPDLGRMGQRAGMGSESGRGDGDDLEWLREQILHVRGLLAEGPVAPGLVRRLYALQRVDRDDVLGEREATMARLADVRSLLDGSPGGPGRRAAEAALGAEVSDAL